MIVDFGGHPRLTRFLVDFDTCEVRKITCWKTGDYYFTEDRRHVPLHRLFEDEERAYIALVEEMAQLRKFAERRLKKNKEERRKLKTDKQERMLAHGIAVTLLQKYRESQYS